MAQSRLERIGTIFTRTSALLRSGNIQEADKPVWYDIYKAFPPKYEPTYSRPKPNIPLKKLYYPEDYILAKFSNDVKNLPAVDLASTKHQMHGQIFMKTYEFFKEAGMSGDELYSAALNQYKNRYSQVLHDTPVKLNDILRKSDDDL